MLLALSIVALLAGPAVYTFGRRNRIARQILDGFIFITIAGIVTVHIIPEALVGGGNLADFCGKIDEVRVSAIARSPAWIRAQYLSMSDSFITYGWPEAF